MTRDLFDSRLLATMEAARLAAEPFESIRRESALMRAAGGYGAAGLAARESAIAMAAAGADSSDLTFEYKMLPSRANTMGRLRLREIGNERRTLPPVRLGSHAVAYLCYIESSLLGVPHFQAMDAETEEEARAEADVLMREHAKAYAAHIFLGDKRIDTIRRLKTPS